MLSRAFLLELSLLSIYVYNSFLLIVFSCCYSVGGGREYSVSIEPTVGEIIEAARVSESTFNNLQS